MLSAYLWLSLLTFTGAFIALVITVEIDFPAPPSPKRKQVLPVGKPFGVTTMKTKLSALSAALLSGIGAAQAAVPAAVTTGLTDNAVDVLAIGGLAFLVFLAAKQFGFFRKAT